MTNRVLIAEDDPVSRTVLEELLHEFGFEVVVCVDGEEAWAELSKDDAPELAIIDWMMPGMHGIDICRKLRENPRANNPYLMLLTVRGAREDKIKGLQAGADDYLTKPFDSEELRARVRVGQRIVRLQRERIEEETSYYVSRLEQTVEELRQSRGRIVEAEEDVRKAIAEELHGHVQTQMMILYMAMTDLSAKIEDQEVKRELDRLALQLDDIRENDIRQISHRLHPSVIRLNLSAGIMSLRDQYERAMPIDIDISEEIQEREAMGGSSIPAKVRLAMYRVAEEAIGNIVKHSGATRAKVGLWIEEGTIVFMSVEDDGRGFDLDDTSSRRSLGLLTIRDHMGAVGGEFSIESKPGQGTKITAHVDISEDE